jgi:phenylacetate-CoA ligase
LKLSKALSNSLYWKIKRLRGQEKVRERLEFLLQAQCRSPEEIRNFQAEKLSKLIRHAYETVPHYRRSMLERGVNPSDISSPDDLRKLPLLTRTLLRVKQKELISSKADFDSLQVNYSSGSTGLRVSFKQDQNFRMWMRAHQLRTYMWCSGWELGDPFVLLWGSEIYWSNKTIADKIENLLTNRREFNTFCLSPILIKRFLEAIESFRPRLISTYSNAMHLIAIEAEKQCLRLPALRAIQGTSEPMPPVFRERIGRIFNCEVFDKFGSRETNIVCHESPRHEEMCIQAENVFVEFLNDFDQPCRPGEQGRVVLTTLNNLSMPLIRYETSDIAAPVAGTCSSGIGLPRMTAVSGRKQDLILTPNGDHIDAYFFSYLFMRFAEVHWFQVVQFEIDRLHICVYAPAGLTPEIISELTNRIHSHSKFRFGLEFEVVSEMPQSPTGKFRLCVSHLTGHYLESAQPGNPPAGSPASST